MTVPLSALVDTTKTAPDTDSLSPVTGATPIAVTDDIAGVVTDDVIPATSVLARALEALREQLAKADQREESQRRRAEQAERRIDELQALLTEARRQIDRLHVDLADAVTAEQIAAGEASALRAIVASLRARPWWRRWLR